MTQLAAPGIQTGQILGVIGTGGISIVITLLLILGVRGKGDLKLGKASAYVVGFIGGTFYATANAFWTAAGTITTSVTGSITSNSSLGDIGPGAVALCVAVYLYAGKPRPSFAGVLGIASATIFGTAGGAWVLPASVIARPLGSWLGVNV